MSKHITQYDGTQYWLNDNNLFHREDGPAIIEPDGYCEYWQDGNLHRKNGPAVEWPNGMNTWYVDGKRYTCNRTYQKAAGISDEDMAMIVLKYGNVS